MKKPMSMSFLLLSILSLLSLGRVWTVLKNLPLLFQRLSPLSYLSIPLSLVLTLMPLALVALLVMNTKRDMKKIAVPGLIALGIAQLLSVALGLRTIGESLRPELYIWLPDLIKRFANLITGILLILGGKSIKEEKKNPVMAVLASIGMYFSAVPLAVGLLTGQGEVSVNIFLLLAGLWLLPVTIFDHENCVLVNGKSMKAVYYLAIIFGVVLVISGILGYSGSSSSRQKTPWEELGVSQSEYMEVYNYYRYGIPFGK